MERIQGEKIERHSRKLPVRLTDEEKLQKGQELAQAANELDVHRLDAKSQKDALKAKETEIVSRIANLASVVRQGSEIRDVQCFGVADFTNGRVLFYREDSEELVGDRVLRMEERQGSLPVEETAPTKKLEVEDYAEKGPANEPEEEDGGEPDDA